MRNTQFTSLKTCLKSFTATLFYLLVAMFLTSPDPALASRYTPEGLYDPIIYRLDNGMRVILKERHGARNVAIRLDIGIGNHDFECYHQETAHFLEHLLFTGTSQHSESELDEIIIDHGGSWNAYTYNEMTVFEIDIFSEFSDVGISVLHEIITDSQLSKHDFELSRGIIYREVGGVPTRISQFLHEHEIISNARSKVIKEMLKGSHAYCSNLTTLDSISHQDILDAYRKFYVPNNMTLVVTGDFQLDKTRDQVQQLFGKMPSRALQRDVPVADKFDRGPLHLSSSLSPVFGIEGTAELVFRTNGYGSPDYYPFQVINHYLNKRLYEVIRVQEGLSYSPDVEMVGGFKDGLFVINADADIKDLDKVTRLMHEEIIQLRDGKVSDEEINQTIKSLLLSWAQGLESNSDIADYYIDNLDEVERLGHYVDQESLLETITPADIRDVAQRYFMPSNMAFLKSVPTLTTNQFYLLAGITFLLLLFFSWRLAKRIGLHIRVQRDAKK